MNSHLRNIRGIRVADRYRVGTKVLVREPIVIDTVMGDEIIPARTKGRIVLQVPKESEEDWYLIRFDEGWPIPIMLPDKSILIVLEN